MGALHDGHLSLVRLARQHADRVVVSLFVNPTQFGPNEDFTRYPRDVPRDLRLCEEHGVDLVFMPDTAEMYPPGSTTFVEVEALQDRWEGASRPGHLRGVATIVTKLFRAIRPQYAYFGEKDYQQLQIVKRLSRDLILELEIVGCPIVREADGLAMSSRNVYLSDADRAAAVALSKALFRARDKIARGERSASRVSEAMRNLLNATAGVDVDYVAVVEPNTLEPLERIDHEARALIAARVGSVRLIDNLALPLENSDG
jgi:pantoate--beta-alanine ligase